jgi:hypothetical protein
MVQFLRMKRLSFIVLLGLLAGCHPQKGDTYRHVALDTRIEITSRGHCEGAGELANQLNARLAELSKLTYTPPDHSDLTRYEECVVFSVLDDISPSGEVNISFDVMPISMLEAQFQRMP